MVVATSDSNTTLVSLGNNNDDYRTKEALQQSPISVVVSVPAFETTNPCSFVDEEDIETNIQVAQERLCIPKDATDTKFLQQYESLADQRDVLLAQDVVVFDDSSNETFVYVSQGEIASTTDCDVLLSDRATTCHILALWSESETSSRRKSTITHIDSAGYEDCVGSAFAAHAAYHKHDIASTTFHVHIVGGYDEDQSHEISFSLLHCLAELSHTYRLLLDTCVVGSLNNHGASGGPRLRGLALDCRTGRVYPAHCNNPMMILGPVRGIRLWSRGDSKKQLLNLFPNEDCTIVIPKCSWGRVSSRWNRLPDEELLAKCSTSPEYEDAEDFCHLLRTTFAFCNQVTPNDVFGKRSHLSFRRLGKTNRWVPIS